MGGIPMGLKVTSLPGNSNVSTNCTESFCLKLEEEARIALENEMLAIHAENLWFLVVLKIAAISPARNIIVHNRMHNVPLPLPGDYTYGKPETWSIGKR